MSTLIETEIIIIFWLITRCLNDIPWHLHICGKREFSTHFKPQNSMLHGVRQELPHLIIHDLWL